VLFQANEPALFTVVTAREPICRELAAQLHKIDPDLTYEFGPVQSGRREFVISADGIRKAFPAVLSLAAAAPELRRWEIIRFRPARPQYSKVKYGGIEVDAGTVQFLGEKEGELTNVTIWVPGYKKTPDQVYEHAIFLLLDRMVGEYAVETGIGSVEIIAPEHRPGGNWRPLTRLQEVVKAAPIK